MWGVSWFAAIGSGAAVNSSKDAARGDDSFTEEVGVAACGTESGLKRRDRCVWLAVSLCHGKVEGMQRPGEGCGTWVGSVLEIPALAHGRHMSVDEHRDFSEPVSSSARRGQYSPCQMVMQPRQYKPSVC